MGSDRQAELAADDQALDLARAFADLEDLGVAIEATHGSVVDVAVATVNLHRVARCVDRDTWLFLEALARGAALAEAGLAFGDAMEERLADALSQGIASGLVGSFAAPDPGT